MQENKFVDRKLELNKFKNDIKKERTKNKIVFLYARTGIGKSFFTKKIISDLNDIKSIRVQTLSGQNVSLEEGYFFKRIAQELDEFARNYKNIPTLNHFLKKPGDPELKNDFWELAIAEAGKSAFPKIFSPLKLLYEKIFSRGSFDSKKLFNSINSQVIILSYYYVKEMLKKNEFLISLENIHLIDKTSLEKIIDVTKEVVANYFIFEYTISDDSRGAEVAKFSEFFQNKNNEIELVKLNQLGFNDFIQLLNVEQTKYSQNILSNAYLKINGNLRKITDFNVLYEDKQEPHIKRLEGQLDLEDEDLTRKNIKTLNQNDLFIFILIVVHKSTININTLKQIYFMNLREELIIDVDASLERICQKHKLIDMDKDKVKIQHDSISSEILRDNLFDKYIVISYKACADYYKKLVENNSYEIISKGEILNNLFHLYYYYDPKRLFSLLDEIKDVAIKSLNPEVALSHIKYILESFKPGSGKQEFIDKLNISLIDIYYYLGLFKEAFKTLNQIKTVSRRLIVYKAVLLDRIDRHADSIEFILQSLEDNAKYSSFDLTLRLILIFAYRSNTDLEKCEEQFNTIQNQEKYQNLYEYGFFLRNAEIVLTYRESLDYLKESIKFFQKRNKKIQEAHSRISYSMQLARLGFLNESKKELDYVDSILKDKTLERHIILNNKAVTKMLEGEFNSEIENLLKFSLITARSNFDNIVINGNLLILLSKIGKTYAASEIVDRILRLLKDETNKILIASIYYNLAIFYKNQNQSELEAKYFRYARENNISYKNSIHYKYWQYRLYNKSLDDTNFEFLAKYDYHFNFMSYWHFEISRNV